MLRETSSDSPIAALVHVPTRSFSVHSTGAGGRRGTTIAPIGMALGRTGIAVVACVLVSGCEILGTGDCTTEGRPALRLLILDAKTHSKPLVGSTILVTDAGFAESFPPPGIATASLDQYLFAIERPGRYAITVRTPGYRDWSRTNIHVGTGSCGHVDTKTVTATLSGVAP